MMFESRLDDLFSIMNSCFGCQGVSEASSTGEPASDALDRTSDIGMGVFASRSVSASSSGDLLVRFEDEEAPFESSEA